MAYYQKSLPGCMACAWAVKLRAIVSYQIHFSGKAHDGAGYSGTSLLQAVCGLSGVES